MDPRVCGIGGFEPRPFHPILVTIPIGAWTSRDLAPLEPPGTELFVTPTVTDFGGDSASVSAQVAVP